jgi:tetratricopeptide (TPR) repeat protein
MTSKEYKKLIDPYLFNKLSDKERKEFEAEMSQNEDLKAAVDLYKLEHQTMELMVQEDLKNQLASWSKAKKIEQTPTKVIPLRVRYARTIQLAVAASVVLMLGFIGLNWVNDNYNSQAISSTYLSQTISTSKGVRGTITSSLPENMELGLQEMENGNYEQAIQLFDEVQEPDFIELAQQLKGENLLKLEKYQAAEDTFQTLIASSQDPRTVEKAEWFLLMTYYASKSHEAEALLLLDKIANNEEHFYYPKASEMKRDLDGFWGKLAN